MDEKQNGHYTTQGGIRIDFISIPQTIRRFLASNPQPEPPTYTITTATGATETHAHTEQTLETPEEKAVWQAYQDRMREYMGKFVRVCVMRGIRVHSKIEDWIDEQAELGITIPDSKLDAKLEWITEYVLTAREDYEAVFLGVMRAMEVPDDLLKQIEGLFHGDMGRDATQPASDSVPEQVANGEPVRGSTHGVQTGDAAKSVRRSKRRGPSIRDTDMPNPGPDAGLGNADSRG